MPPVARQSAVINVMVKAAEKAAKSLVRDFGEVEHLQVSQKGPSDFVSAADKKSEQIIVEELLKGRPKFGVMGEEGSSIKGEDGEHRWIIDPLDGTFNFLHAIPHWSITIALERKGEILAGIVYDPIKHEMFWAEKGVGAYVNSKRLRVSSRKKAEQALIIAGMPAKGYGDHKLFETEIAPVIRGIGGTRSLGSAALDLSYVAAGRADAYWERRLAPWDLSAGMLLVREAGGFASLLDSGEKPPYDNGVIAGNATFYPMLLEMLGNPATSLKAVAAKTVRS